ncbi:Deoxycytidine monophosphate (dCMP) deaminase [Apophysomyces sp. BC1034]|nr:Deoxycytidine monophosphate (dCMP) deaminase [Apophysomyces sp. BC1015]KAG0177439.1 Deoxycytidine monophosphate (dCMP) deaminase [Apophysomyces sp. BC1021]KAG0187735.1 Deoxycytidine monophosphate (dCMP) deaminase [Apophysomyces sp. BC1034]
MFIGLTGPSCGGKHTVAEYLVSDHGFSFLALENNTHKHSQLYEHALLFPTLEELQIYVTERWRENFVICDIDSDSLWLLKKRPFFLLVSVEAPIHLRYRRCLDREGDGLTLEQFVLQDDLTLFHNDGTSANPTSLYTIMPYSDVTITNAFSDRAQLHDALKRLNLLNLERLRPSWDTYFMHLSDLAARRSNCMKRRVGCILVKDSRVIATGYNGTPRGLRNCNEGGCDRCNEGAPCGTGLDRCLCMHAEENALLEAGRSRVDFSTGVVLYCNTCPCLGCAVKIVQQGIKEVVYSISYGMDQMTARIFAEAKVKLRQHSPPSMRLEMMDMHGAIVG